MNTARKLGCIDAVQTAKSIKEVREIEQEFSFHIAHPKTARRFARKAAARIASLTPATK